MTVGAAAVAWVLFDRARPGRVVDRFPVSGVGAEARAGTSTDDRSGLARTPSRVASALTTRVAALLQPFRTMAEARRSRAALEHELPALAELLRTALTAGLSPAQAIRLVAPLAPPVASRLLSHAASGLGLGLGLSAALDPLRSASHEAAGVTDALCASAELGAGAEGALGRIADEARVALRQRAEARARTVPVRLLFPLVLCVLPAFALLGVAPALLAGFAG